MLKKEQYDCFLKEARETLGQNYFYELDKAYLDEPRGLLQSKSKYVVKPSSTQEVSVFLKLANKYNVAIVPRSGGTGLVGGQISSDENCIILSLEKMNKIRNFSILNQAVEVESGVNLSDLKEFISVRDYFLPLSMASEGSCLIGGNLATNAGGVNVLQYGNTRDLCMGIEVVLADGTIVNDLKEIKKDNAGYDLKNLFIGSEGTLGVITSAVMKVFPKPKKKIVSLLALSDPKEAVLCYHELCSQLGIFIQAYEIISSVGVDFLEEKNISFVSPFKNRPDWMVLIELAFNSDDVEEKFLSCLEKLQQKNLIIDAVISENLTKAEQIWAMRESIPEANRLVGAISSHDISVPIDKISEFIKTTNNKIKTFNPQFRINCFGHIGDGNLHYNIFPPKKKINKEYYHERKKLKEIIHDTCYELKGSISAEHGIGRLKVDDLVKYVDKGKFISMVAIKKALDPSGILNPGAVFKN